MAATNTRCTTMDLLEFPPENVLEQAIAAAQDGSGKVEDLTTLLVQSNIYALSKTEVAEDGSGFTPLLMDDEEGAPLVAVFSALSRARPHRALAEFPLQMPGRALLLRLPAGYGAVLNPGYDAQMVIPPEAVAELKAQLQAG